MLINANVPDLDAIIARLDTILEVLAGGQPAGSVGGRNAPTPLMTAAEVAEWARISRWSVYRLAEIGRIPHMKIGSSLRFDPVAIQAWIADRTTPSMERR
jgi:excisionase family DNA binding protein